MNRFGTLAVGVFIGILFIGYLLISRPAVHVTVTSEAATVLSGVLSGTALRLLNNRRYRR